MRILDVGVGTGRTTAFLQQSAARYVGIDYAAAMIGMARSRFAHADLRVGDASDLSAFQDGRFDAVVFSFNGLDYLHPRSSRTRALREFHRVLAPGGTLIFSTHNPRACLRRPSAGNSSVRGWMREWGSVARRSIRISASHLRRAPFWTGNGYATDPFRALVTYYATPRHVIAELDAVGFDVARVIGSDAPRRSRSWLTPWYYYACHRQG
jgi:ubiquinone/menaquinone biosynthesis C-methylase UbiE